LLRRAAPITPRRQLAVAWAGAVDARHLDRLWPLLGLLDHEAHGRPLGRHIAAVGRDSGAMEEDFLAGGVGNEAEPLLAAVPFDQALMRAVAQRNVRGRPIAGAPVVATGSVGARLTPLAMAVAPAPVVSTGSVVATIPLKRALSPRRGRRHRLLAAAGAAQRRRRDRLAGTLLRALLFDAEHKLLVALLAGRQGVLVCHLSPWMEKVSAVAPTDWVRSWR
jgi:hypothetical protein